MKKIFLNNKKKIIFLTPVLALLLFFIFFPNIVHASAVATVLGWILYPFISLIGKLTSLLLGVFVSIAQYNDFINSAAVSYGWIIVRDLCNMFFVVILLIIAIATILRVEQYNLKTWLPKLVIMAILINFSKLICGVFIDFAQVIMLTFVNAFKDLAGANLSHMLGLTDIMNVDPETSGDEVTAGSVVGSLILALVFVIIALVVILTMLAMLVIRMIMIWIYVVLSPLAYLLASFPQGQTYSQRWWSEFSKNLIIGPVLAFFIWLSFASLGGVGSQAEIDKIAKADEIGEDGIVSDAPTAAITEAGSKDNVIKLIISIGMLLGGMMIAQEMGGQAGKVVGKGMANLQAIGSGALKMGKRVTGVERAQNAYKAYQQRKETVRTDRAQRDAGLMLKGESAVKKGIAYLPNKARQGVDSLVKKGFGVGKAEKDLTNKKQEKASLDLDINDIDVKIKVEIENSEKGQNKVALANNLEQSSLKVNELNSELSLMSITDPKRSDKEKELKEEKLRLDSFVSDAGFSSSFSATDIANLKNQGEVEISLADSRTKILEGEKEGKMSEVENINQKIASREGDLLEKKKLSEWASKGLSAAIGGISGGLLGGLPGAVLGAVGGVAARNKIMHAGETSKNLASNHNSEQINKHKERIKDESSDQLRKISEDYSLPTSHRTAADLTLMERGDLSNEEAQSRRDRVSKNYGNDNKVGNQLESSLAHHYQGLSGLFQDLNSSDKNTSERAQEKIVKGIVNGSIKVDGINDQSAMSLIAPKLAEALNPANFSNLYKSQTVKKQSMISLALDKSKATNPKSASMLVNIKKDLGVLDDSGAKGNYLKGADISQLQNLTESNKGIESIVKHLKDVGQLDRFRDLAMKNQVNDIAREFGKIASKVPLNYTNPSHRSIINGVIDGIKKFS